MGCPETLITDQGREFVNELSSELYQITNTDHRITSAYHPQSNGLTERFNQTLSRCLAKITDESHSDWDMKIDTVLLGIAAAYHTAVRSDIGLLTFNESRLRAHLIKCFEQIEEINKISTE